MFYPNLIVIGAMKAGTSTLHDYLSLHPEIYASKTKELDYFLWNYKKGPEWYKRNFPENRKYRLESSPNYTKFYKDWSYPAQRIQQDLPGCKLIYILRNPVERTLSQCRHHELNPNEVIPALLKSDEKHEIISNSKYHLHLREYLKYFSSEQILLLKMHQLTTSPQQVLNTVASFLGVSDFHLRREIHSNESGKMLHASKIVLTLNEMRAYHAIKKYFNSNSALRNLYKRIFYRRHKIYPVSQKVRESLVQYFQDDINQLESLTDMSFNEWKSKS